MPAFISHSFQDLAVYSTLCLALDSAGADHWDPKTMAYLWTEGTIEPN